MCLFTVLPYKIGGAYGIVGFEWSLKLEEVYKEVRGLTLNTMVKLPLFSNCDELLHLKQLGSFWYLENKCSKRWHLTGKSEL